MSQNISLHILVVDDSPEMLELKDDILESEGFHVSTMLRRDTGVAEIVAVKPDLLVMEYLPREHASLTNDLAEHPIAKRIPMLLCSRASEALTEHPDTSGVRIIRKPFDIDDFLAAVHGLIGQSPEPNQT